MATYTTKQQKAVLDCRSLFAAVGGKCGGVRGPVRRGAANAV